MKVFVFKCNVSYGGGLAIVAANSVYEAYGALCNDSKFYAEFYDIEHSEELDNVSADVNEPKILAENSYIE